MRLLHKGVKMHAAFALCFGRFNKVVHQHGFATPNPAPKVNSLGGNGRFAQQAFQQLWASIRVCFQPNAQGFQQSSDLALLRISLESATRDAFVQDFGQGFAHRPV